MREITTEEEAPLLLGGARTAGLGPLRGDDRPHVALVWFGLDGDRLVFIIWHESQGSNLLRDFRVSLYVGEETPPFAFVLVEDTAEEHGRYNGVPG